MASGECVIGKQMLVHCFDECSNGHFVLAADPSCCDCWQLVQGHCGVEGFTVIGFSCYRHESEDKRIKCILEAVHLFFLSGVDFVHFRVSSFVLGSCVSPCHIGVVGGGAVYRIVGGCCGGLASYMDGSSEAHKSLLEFSEVCVNGGSELLIEGFDFVQTGSHGRFAF